MIAKNLRKGDRFRFHTEEHKVSHLVVSVCTTPTTVKIVVEGNVYKSMHLDYDVYLVSRGEG